MTTADVISEWEKYYSRPGDKINYNETEKKYITQWLDKKTSKERKFILYEVLTILSKQYRTLPDIATMEQAYKQMWKNKADRLEDRRAFEYKAIEAPEISDTEVLSFWEQVYRRMGDVVRAKNVRKKHDNKQITEN